MIILHDESEQTTNKEYFFPKMNKEVTGILQLEAKNNLLVLNFTANSQFMGSLLHTYYDDFEETIELINTNCSAITFHMPGETTIDGTKYDLELQVNCSQMIKNALRSLYISIPVLIDENQSKFFNELKFPENPQLPFEIKINDFYDMLDPLTVFDTIYRYQGYDNFPPCSNVGTWFVIKRPLKVSKEKYNLLWNSLDLDKNPDGNARTPTEKDIDVVLNYYYNHFS